MRKGSMLIAVVLLTFAGAAIAQVTYSNRPPPPLPYQQPYQQAPQPQYYSNQPGYGYPGYGNQTVSCGSPQYRFQRCGVSGNWRGARIVRQTSSSSCVQGQTWGYDNGSIWVNKGCGGVFAPGNFYGGYNGGNGGGWRPGPGWNRDFTVSCGSPQYHYAFCQVDVGSHGRVVLQRQTSNTRCVEGRNWGWNRAGVWVNDGCGAQFRVTRRW